MTCPECTSEFSPSSNGQRYCAEACKQKALKLRRAEAYRAKVADKPRKNRTAGWWENELLPVAAEIVDSYSTRVTLRQLFYRLVANGMLTKPADYDQLSHHTANARRCGSFPSLIDDGRNVMVAESWGSWEDATKDIRRRYRRDRTEGQEYQVFIGIEKAALSAQLYSWFGHLGIPILPLRGFSSVSFEEECQAHFDGRPSVFLYGGDADSYGHVIEEVFLDYVDFDVTERVALRDDQLDLSPSGKIDGIEPNMLRRLYQDAIDEYWNADAYEAVRELEKKELAA